jgi:DNA-binding CsgD family transcriptional regulator
VLAGGAPDIGAPARARLVAHWTAEGHDQEWIARRLRIGVRQVRRDLTGGSR